MSEIRTWRGPVTKILYVWELQDGKWVLIEAQGKKKVSEDRP